jgi:hypothetical protein
VVTGTAPIVITGVPGVTPNVTYAPAQCHLNARSSTGAGFVTWASAAYNPNALWVAGSPTLITIASAGTYILQAGVNQNAANVGMTFVGLAIILNGATNLVFPVEQVATGLADNPGVEGGLAVRLAAADTIQLFFAVDGATPNLITAHLSAVQLSA